MPTLRALVPAALAALTACAVAAVQPAATPAPAAHSAVAPVPREQDWWTARHDSFNARAAQAAQRGDIRVIFIGDSITQGWEGPGKDVWEKKFAPMGAVNFGISGDRTQHVLWRLRNGNLDGLAAPASGEPPRAVVLMIGTNNTNGDDNTADEIADGVATIVGELRTRLPSARVLLLGIFPRGQGTEPSPQREKIARVNGSISKLADGDRVRYLDLASVLTELDGSISPSVMPDYLHLSAEGYGLWANSIEAELKRMLAAP